MAEQSETTQQEGQADLTQIFCDELAQRVLKKAGSLAEIETALGAKSSADEIDELIAYICQALSKVREKITANHRDTELKTINQIALNLGCHGLSRLIKWRAPSPISSIQVDKEVISVRYDGVDLQSPGLGTLVVLLKSLIPKDCDIKFKIVNLDKSDPDERVKIHNLYRVCLPTNGNDSLNVNNMLWALRDHFWPDEADTSRAPAAPFPLQHMASLKNRLNNMIFLELSTNRFLYPS